MAQSRLCWAKTDGSDSSFSLDYKHIAIHAVCRDTSQFPRSHVYVMVDSELFPEDAEESEEEDETADPEDKCTSVRFVPANLDSLSVIYKAISDCQLLHPDPQDESDNEPPEDDEDEGEYDVHDGPLPVVQYENQPYEENMENGLGEVVTGNGYAHIHGDGAHDDDQEEAMDHDQFEDC